MNKKEIEFYITQIVYEKIFTPEECDRILGHAEILREVDAEFLSEGGSYKGNRGFDKKTRDTKIKLLNQNPEVGWVVERIKSMTEKLNNENYKIKLNKLDIIQLLKYEENGHISWHVDAGTDLPFSNRKLSIVVFLSDRNDYEGGQLEIPPATKEKIPMEKGYMIMFPSYKTHRVTPVTKGVRYALVSWALCD